MIFHIATLTEWEHAPDTEPYQAASLPTEGFIHCSTREQIPAVASRFYHGRTDLVLIRINEAHLDVPLRFENFEGGEERYPHIYGPIPRSAITGILPFPPEEDGTFRFPETSA